MIGQASYCPDRHIATVLIPHSSLLAPLEPEEGGRAASYQVYKSPTEGTKSLEHHVKLDDFDEFIGTGVIALKTPGP